MMQMKFQDIPYEACFSVCASLVTDVTAVPRSDGDDVTVT